MLRKPLLVRRTFLALGAIALACSRPVSSFSDEEIAAIERAAITGVFLTYEHPQQLVFWRGAPRESPIFDELPIGDSLLASPVAVDRLNLPVPVSTISQRELAAFFRQHADAWENWFRLRPGTGGVVEITAPVRQSPTRGSVVVGRRCGEHCRNAWRVTVKQSPSGQWATEKVEPIVLPIP